MAFKKVHAVPPENRQWAGVSCVLFRIFEIVHSFLNLKRKVSGLYHLVVAIEQIKIFWVLCLNISWFQAELGGLWEGRSQITGLPEGLVPTPTMQNPVGDPGTRGNHLPGNTGMGRQD